MAELEFILSKVEEETLLKTALGSSCWFVPDINYGTAKPAHVTTYEEFKKYRERTRMFFILHESYIAAPLEMREILKDGQRVFFVMQRNGGPSIDFMSSVEFIEEGRTKINPGSLAHHKTFWNPKTRRNEETPGVLLKLYRELSAVVKKVATRHKVGVRTYWIGNAVHDRIKSGQLDLGIVPQR